ncbi:MAG: hypothetical protein ABEJ36_02040 [Candidatus Nanosalina sp.]
MSDFDPWDYSVREVPEPEPGIDVDEASEHIRPVEGLPDLFREGYDGMLEPDVDMSGPDIGPPDLGGEGGLVSGGSSSGGGGYVPSRRRGDDLVDGGGLLDAFVDEIDDETPFMYGVDDLDGRAYVARPDGVLAVSDEDGLSVSYTGELFRDPDVSSEAKRFDGNVLDLKEASLDAGRIKVEKGEDEYEELVVPVVESVSGSIDYPVRKMGGEDLGVAFTLKNEADARQLAREFAVPGEPGDRYEPDFQPGSS